MVWADTFLFWCTMLHIQNFKTEYLKYSDAYHNSKCGEKFKKKTSTCADLIRVHTYEHR